MAERELPKHVAETLDLWFRYKFYWWRVHYILGIAALFCSVTVASRPLLSGLFSGAPTILDVLAWASAICVGLLTFLAPTKRTRGYLDGYRILYLARNRYVNDPDYTLQQLLDVVQQGEDRVAKGDPF